MSVEFLELLPSLLIKSFSLKSMVESQEISKPSILEPTPVPTNSDPITEVPVFNQYDIYPYPHPLFGNL